jgi:hypothetical protein
MFDPTSRYAALPIAEAALPDGRVVAYVRRRFLPRPDSLPVLAEVAAADGERLDHVSARTLGDPTQFWRIADANAAVDPDDLVERPGRVLRVPQPQAGA